MSTQKFITLGVLTLLMCLGCKQTSKEKQEVEVEETVEASWTDKERDAFSNNCNAFLKAEGVDASESYCDCLLAITMEAHPDPVTAMALEQQDIVKLFEESGCLDEYLMVKIEDPWTEEVSQAFLTKCKQERIEQGLPEDAAAEYCSCALEKVKELIPQPQHVLQLTPEELKSILENCTE